MPSARIAVAFLLAETEQTKPFVNGDAQALGEADRDRIASFRSTTADLLARLRDYPTHVRQESGNPRTSEEKESMRNKVQRTSERPGV